MRTQSYNPTPLWIARRLRGVSQHAAAEAIGLSRATIARAELGDNRVSEAVLQKYADWLGVSFSSLQYQHRTLPEKKIRELSQIA